MRRSVSVVYQSRLESWWGDRAAPLRTIVSTLVLQDSTYFRPVVGHKHRHDVATTQNRFTVGRINARQVEEVIVHACLQALAEEAGDPACLFVHPAGGRILEHVARRIADEARVICFDEFFVSDITDAMILGGLFELLFDYGVSLVATSNIIPDGLYKDGLQRSRFLPAIAMLNKHTQVVNVDGGVDYRLRTLEQAELYHSPLDVAADESLQRSFDQLNPDDQHVQLNFDLEINDRPIKVRSLSDDVAWFDFAELCDGPRSQNDYIELAREFHAVLIGNVPQLGGANDDQARRFINMIDEFYDRQVKLVITAAVPLEQLYAGGRLDFEFERTQSRLLEMQSHDYLALEHRP